MKLRNKEELEEKVMKNIFLGKALEYIFKKTGKVRNKTILEFGCGLGEMCVFFAFNGNHAIGVDLKEESINICQEYARLHKVEDTCHFIIGSSESMPVDTASIDIVFSRSSIQYMNHEKVISECLRVLKPGCQMKMIVPWGAGHTAVKDPTHYRFFDEQSFKYLSPDNAWEYGFVKGWRVLQAERLSKELDIMEVILEKI